MSSFWSGSAATDSLDDSLVGRTGSCEASMHEVSILATDTVHVEDGNISSVDEGANELSVPCPNGSRTNRLKAVNSRAFKELEYLVVAGADPEPQDRVCAGDINEIAININTKSAYRIPSYTSPFLYGMWLVMVGKGGRRERNVGKRGYLPGT